MGHKQSFKEIFNFGQIDAFAHLWELTESNMCAQMELVDLEAHTATVEQGGPSIAHEAGWEVRID